ncbi:MAG: F0F1 ATP synthase subunit delta [Rhodospirillales bacterium]
MTAKTQGFSGLAERYATALFDLAEADKALDAVAEELRRIEEMIGESLDLRRLIRSPVISRGDQARATDAVLKQAGIGDLCRRFVGLVAHNRRLFALPAMIAAYHAKLAARRGETTAEVVSAKALTKAQLAAVVEALSKAVGGKIALATRVDPDLLGGLVVKVGSRMVDSSLRTKLNRMRLAMKGVG